MKTTKKLLSLLLCLVMALGLVPFTANEAQAAGNGSFTDVNVTTEKNTPTSPTDVEVYTVKISFTLVNQVDDSTYVAANFVSQRIEDEDGLWEAPNAIGRTYVSKDNGGKGEITIESVTPGKYQLVLRNSNSGALYESKELYTLDKLEQPELTLADPNGVLNDLTYGDRITSTLGMGVTSSINGVYVNDIKSSDESVVKITGSSNSIKSIEIVSAGSFSIIAKSNSHTYWKAKETTFGPYTVNKKDLNVTVDVKDKQYDGTNNAAFEASLVSSDIIEGDDVTLVYEDVNASFESSAAGTDIPITFDGNFTLTGEDAGKYTLVIPKQVTADIYNNYTAQKGVDYTVNSNEWMNEDFVVTAAEGYSLSLTNTADGTWTDQLSASAETANGTLEFYVKNDTGAISLKATENYKIDKTAPTGAITVHENSWGQDKSWNALESDITFDIFSKDKYIVTIVDADALSGVKKIEYLLSDTAISKENISAQTEWITYPADGFELTQEDKYIVYVKITDNSNNVTYISSQGMVIDKTAPVLSGAENGKTYCSAVEITVTEDNLKEVKVGGTAVSVTDGKFTVSPADGKQEIVVTDMAGNSETITITVNDGHTFTNYVSNNDATCTEDGTKTAECDFCDAIDEKSDTGSALGHDWDMASYNWAEDGSSCTATRICKRDSQHTETAQATVEDEVTVNPTCTEMGVTTYTATFSVDWAEEQTKTLTDVDALGHDEISHEAKAATCTEIGWDEYVACSRCDYTTYSELAATGHSYGTEWKSDKDNHWHECSVCGDKADMAKHTPKTVNAKEATNSEKGYTGDTVCKICGYEIAKGKVIPVIADPNSPQTGDNSYMALWIFLMFASLAGVCGTVLYSKKKKAVK